MSQQVRKGVIQPQVQPKISFLCPALNPADTFGDNNG